MSAFKSKLCSFQLSVDDIGLSGVHALPLAAGINVGGHYKWHFLVRDGLYTHPCVPGAGCRVVPGDVLRSRKSQRNLC
jgi:hypothetical protein